MAEKDYEQACSAIELQDIRALCRDLLTLSPDAAGLDTNALVASRYNFLVLGRGARAVTQLTEKLTTTLKKVATGSELAGVLLELRESVNLFGAALSPHSTKGRGRLLDDAEYLRSLCEPVAAALSQLDAIYLAGPPEPEPEPSLEPLTEGDEKIAALVRKEQGLQSKEIAAKLLLTPDHVRKVLSRKLGPLGFYNRGRGYYPPKT